jgi:Tetratricopeptide repeat
MTSLLEGARPRWAVLLISLFTAILVCFQASRNWAANHRVHSGELAMVERGVALEPGNADAWDRLGRFHEWDFEKPDPSQAIADYRQALGRDPLSAHYWMDLASAYEAAGNDSEAQKAFDKARAVYPTSAEVAWSHGNFLLRQQRFSEGFAEIRRAVQGDPGLLPLAISRTWRASRDVNQLLDQVLPADQNSYFQALDFFASIRDTSPGLAVWQRLVEMKKPFPLPRSFPFLDELISEDRADDARRVWREALAAAGMPHSEPANQSLIWNGDFGQDFLNGGLDWRWGSPIGVMIDFDPNPPPNGGRALRLDFGGGTNLDLSEPYQFVPVEPNRIYHFHGYLRTADITTESGVRFSVNDPHHAGEANLLTEGLMGSHTWTPVDADVATGSETRFLIVRLRRIPSRLFDNKLGGSVYVADVSLIPSPNSAEKSSP